MGDATRSLLVLLFFAGWAHAQDRLPTPPAALAKLGVLKRVPYSQRWFQPIFLTSVPGAPASTRVVVEKTGCAWVHADWSAKRTPLFCIPELISRGSEQGLLGLAFHPEFASNRRFFINYTDKRGDTHVAELRASPDQLVAIPESLRDVLVIKQPYSNHNGGHLAFGPDRKLYVGTGDGGAANDPHGHAQNPESLLGKMLVLDVGLPHPKPEILATGLRNPWRYAFDRVTKDLYIGDVGQNLYEEIDVAPYERLRGLNFGWNTVEGLAHCLGKKSCEQSGLTQPAVEYSHKVGCSVTGGYVYRGKRLPELDGIYFYADFCTALIRGFRWKDGRAQEHFEWRPAFDRDSKLAKISSFGEDASGELFVLTLEGDIYELVRR